MPEEGARTLEQLEVSLENARKDREYLQKHLVTEIEHIAKRLRQIADKIEAQLPKDRENYKSASGIAQMVQHEIWVGIGNLGLHRLTQMVGEIEELRKHELTYQHELALLKAKA